MGTRKGKEMNDTPIRDATAIVTARSRSSRLPGKCLVEICDGLSAIQIVIRRAALTGLPVVLATSDHPSDDMLADIAAAEGIPAFRGSETNKIKRWHDCFAHFGIHQGVLVDGDDLTLDYFLVRRVVARMATSPAELFAAPADITPGLFTYAITGAALKRLYAAAVSAVDTDVIRPFIEKAGLQVEEVALEEADERGRTVRLTIDYSDDVEFYRQLYRAVRWDAPALKVVRTALDTGIWRVNWARQDDYLHNQRKFIKEVAGDGG